MPKLSSKDVNKDVIIMSSKDVMKYVIKKKKITK